MNEKVAAINNFFGDMDLFLMDLILKGRIKDGARVLDIGCGDGRNAVYFINNSFPYLGVDTDDSKIRMLQYVAESCDNARFKVADFINFYDSKRYDLVICSRVLHFLENENQLLDFWNKVKEHLAIGGIVYASMDSIIGTHIPKKLKNGNYEFPDGAVRLVLKESTYNKMKVDLVEIEPLKTLIIDNSRVQSFMILQRKS